MKKTYKDWQTIIGETALSLLVFSLSLLVVGFFLSTFTLGDELVLEDIPSNIRSKAFIVNEDNQLVSIAVHQKFSEEGINKWRVFSVDVLDSAKRYLATIESETFYETGPYYNERWVEQENSKTSFIVLHKGQYYFDISTKESHPITDYRPFFRESSVVIKQQILSRTIIYICSGIGLLVAIVLFSRIIIQSVEAKKNHKYRHL
jgi:hypothetical protein